MLRQWRLTPSAFAALPADEQTTLIGIEMYRETQFADWRKALIGDGDEKANRFSSEVATLLLIESL